MPKPIDFYFDFSSPYGCLAAELIEALAQRHAREVRWHPILLGVVFKATGMTPLTEVPLKGEYSKRDMPRSARFHGIAGFRMPSHFPIATQVPARIVLKVRQQDPAQVAAVVKALYRAYFFDDIDISDADTAAAIAARSGSDAAGFRAAVDDPAIKDALRQEVAEAIAAGVFGSPFIVVDGEPFWGIDRFPQIERWLSSGGF
jgi:2-hydroxychromene-2-carboxylate isomerase